MTGYIDAWKRIKASRFLPAYLFYGEEDLLRDELTALLAEAFLGDRSGYGWEKLDGANTSLEQALARFCDQNLFTERRLLVVDNPSFFASPDGARAAAGEGSTGPLEHFLKQEGAREIPENIILFRARAVDRRRRFFRLMQEKGTVVECAPLRGADLSSWIRRRVSRQGKQIAPDALERLLASGDSGLYHLAGELDKYITYLRDDEDTITAAVVDLLYTGDDQGNVFNMADALAEGNPGAALRMLRLLLGRREDPVFLFFMIVRQFRLLLACRSLLDAKVPQSRHAAALKVKPFVASILSRQAASWRSETLEEIILLLQDIDLRIKTGKIEPRQALEIAIARIHRQR